MKKYAYLEGGNLRNHIIVHDAVVTRKCGSTWFVTKKSTFLWLLLFVICLIIKACVHFLTIIYDTTLSLC